MKGRARAGSLTTQDRMQQTQDARRSSCWGLGAGCTLGVLGTFTVVMRTPESYKITSPLVPTNFWVAFGLAIVSLVAWGTWSNTAKLAERVQPTPLHFAHFYWDWSIAVALTGCFAFLTLGAAQLTQAGGDTPLALDRVLSAVAAGVIFNIANVLLVIGITLAGLSTAFPLGIGTALVLGTVLTWLIDESSRSGNNVMLFGGVLLGLLAVVAIAAADAAKQNGYAPIVEQRAITASRRASNSALTDAGLGASDKLSAARSVRRNVAICVGAGVLMSCWPPLSAYSMAEGAQGALTPYSSFLFYSLAVLGTSIGICLVLMRASVAKLMGSVPSTCGEYAQRTLDVHALGWAGGALWAVGTLSNLVAGSTIGLALSYAVGQSAPMVATLWGITYFREFQGAPKKAKAYLGLMFLLYGGAIATIALSK